MDILNFVIIVDVRLTMKSFEFLLGDECRGHGPESPKATIISACKTTQKGGGRLPLGFERGMGRLTIPDIAQVLANRIQLTDVPVPEVALRAPVCPKHSSPERERIPARSQKGGAWQI
jgi:hypothetical protein